MERYEEIERSLIKTYRKGIWRRFIKCINEYRMMNEGDKIAVCISGGAQSFVMAKCAQEIQRHGVFKFDLRFITCGSVLGKEELEKIADNARLLNIPLEIFDAEGDITDCLLEKAASLGCNKIALGNNFDDTVEAILENMLMGGKISTLMPKEKRGGIEIIRPLGNVKQKDIMAWTRFNNLSFTEKQDKNTEIRELISHLRKTSPYIEKNILSSVKDVNLTTVIAYSGHGKSYNFLDDYDERGNINA